MRSKCNHIIILFLIFFVASLGTSLAGSPVCSPGCPDCVVVPACCADMAGDTAATTGTTNTVDDHLAKRSGCTHGGICFDDFQPVDLSVTISSIDYETAFVQLSPNLAIQTNQIPRDDAPIYIRPTIKSFTPLFLRNCSFLI